MEITADLTLCHRCGHAPKLPGQRVCRGCLTTYQRERRARQRQRTAGVGEAAPAEVVTQPAPLLAERPLCLCQLCGYSAWFEWTPGDWRCRLCGRTP